MRGLKAKLSEALRVDVDGRLARRAFADSARSLAAPLELHLLPRPHPARDRATQAAPMAHPGTPRFSGGRVAVDSPDVASLTLLNPLPVWARCYVLPWLVLYPLAYHAFFNEYDQWIKSIGESLPPPLSSSSSSHLPDLGTRLTAHRADAEPPRTAEWTFLLSIVLFGGHALSFLFTRWSISFRSRGEATRTNHLESAHMVMVLPKLHRGKPGFCTLEHTKVRPPSLARPRPDDRLLELTPSSTLPARSPAASRPARPHLLLVPARQVPVRPGFAALHPHRLPVRLGAAPLDLPVGGGRPRDGPRHRDGARQLRQEPL